jgi:glycine cleavage system aminomethyltransferase T
MKPGRARHAIMCSGKGNIIRNGVVLRISEDEFQCYTFAPLIELLANSGRYNVDPMPIAEFNDFIFQIGGPKSLEILERAAGEDLHDIKFMNFRNTTISGHTVRILRMGMAGTLGYELHGTLDHARDVYERIYETGKAYGMEKLGALSYNICNHTENGFPQTGAHFLTAEAECPEFAKHMGKACSIEELRNQISGSYSENPEDLYRNPFEFGWDNMVGFNHDYLGKEALAKIKESGNHRRIVSLEWNEEDTLDVIGSFLSQGEKPYKMMNFPHDPMGKRNVDKVIDNDGNVVGAAMGRLYTLYYRKMISLAILDPELTKIGTEVNVVWGNKDDRKKNIRATVARYPYLDMVRNEHYNVESIPKIY